ncbi:Trm112 family protein [Haliangium sp.]|uniref:Trm112 family protein n=1 Tax=Haliangium sp. TaxID=2663208 RepID=UPI003D11D79F
MELPRALFQPPDDRDGDGREGLILRCTECGGELGYLRAEGVLFCARSRLRFPITEDGIPVMLIDEAERLDQAAVDALVARLP